MGAAACRLPLVESLLVDFLDLGNQRIARVGGGALVLEGAVAELLEPRHEDSLIHAALPDGHRTIDLLHQGAYRVGQGLDALLGGVKLEPEVLGDLGIFLVGHEFAVFRPGSEFGGLGAVVLDHIGQQHRVGQAVRDVVLAAELVGHRVVEPKERVGEGHTGDAGGVVHLLPGFLVGVAILISARQVLEDHLDRLHGKAVGVVRGKDRNISLDRVGQHVQAGVAGRALGQGHDELRVDDRDIRGELVVGQRVLDIPVLLVGDDREGGDLTAGTRGGRDTDHLGLVAQVREVIGSLADVEEL